ncbi:MAG: deoxyribose-phosphate aldolase [Desulfobacterales bacterium]|nr:deoxyribose-phosphate aldolase [Desulfobacterales bacterium]
MYFKDIKELVRLIDHTILKTEAAKDDIERICEEAIRYGFFSVCVNPWWIKTVKKRLEGSNVKVCSVVGFPLGMDTAKAGQAKRAIEDGADELDMVLAVGALKSGLYKEVKDDIEKVVFQGKPVKVILETCLLGEEEIRKACRLCIEAGASFVKTSTGFSLGGAETDIIRIMKQEVGDSLGIKASGGIGDLKTLVAMVQAGATRIGASGSVGIAEEFLKEVLT